MVPKLSAPLTKSIRTLEGVLVLASNGALVFIPFLTSSLSAGQAVKYGVILNMGYAAARSVLKGIAALGGSEPAPTPDLGYKLADPEQALKAMADAANQGVSDQPPDPLNVGPSAADLTPQNAPAGPPPSAPSSLPQAPGTAA